MRISHSLAIVPQVFAATVALLFVLSSPVAAQKPSNPTELNVAVAVVPPFVMEQNGSLTGFSIDLWNAVISFNAQTTFLITLAPNVTDL
jgi:polar amino acid transport system substrate-binding protein